MFCKYPMELTFIPEGCQPLPLAGIPSGCGKVVESRSGGIVALNHRLMAGIPPGWLLTRFTALMRQAATCAGGSLYDWRVKKAAMPVWFEFPSDSNHSEHRGFMLPVSLKMTRTTRQNVTWFLKRISEFRKIAAERCFWSCHWCPNTLCAPTVRAKRIASGR